MKRKLLALAIVALGLGYTGFERTLIRELSATVPPKKQIKPSLPSFKNWGLLNSEGNAHIAAPEAWRIEKGSKNVLVAVIDTGIDAFHPDLKINVKHNGWDFVKNKPALTDEHGHGTHVAGIIGAVQNLREGISGVAQSVSLMPIKYYSESNSGTTNLKNTIKALNYAIENGAKIINYSGGGPEFSEEEYLAMKKAEAKGILVIAAAGNERSNIDIVDNYYYPAAYRLPNIISVASIDIKGNLLASSNWGKKRVDVAAPGENIYSTLPGGRYGYMSGTSQATAFVTGLAALILSKNPSLSPAEVRHIIVSSTDQLPGLKDKIMGGKLNAYRALMSLSKPHQNPVAFRLIAAPGFE